MNQPTQYDKQWLNEVMVPLLDNYQVEYLFFEQGDFGSLDQLRFETALKGGEIDCWSSGWFGITMVDYVDGGVLLNCFLGPDELVEKQARVDELLKLL